MSIQAMTVRKQAILVLGLLVSLFLIQQVVAQGSVDTSAAEQEIGKIGTMIINICKGPIAKALMVIFFIVGGVSLGKQNFGAGFGWLLAGLIVAFAPALANAIFK